MTKDQHKVEHRLLHGQLEQLVADFTYHVNKLPSRTSLQTFLNWSFLQTVNPTNVREEVSDAK